MFDRKLIQDVYIRVCKDSGFQLDYVAAADLAARVVNCTPLDVMIAFGLDNMMSVADGSHPSMINEELLEKRIFP